MQCGMSEPLQKSLELGFLHKQHTKSICGEKVLWTAAEAESHCNPELQGETSQSSGRKLLILCDHHSGFQRKSRRVKSKPSLHLLKHFSKGKRTGRHCAAEEFECSYNRTRHKRGQEDNILWD